MKLPLCTLTLAFLAFGTQSCTYTEKLYTASGYDARDAYNQGFRHGSGDRAAGKAHDPHINDPMETPSSFRKDYLWGYTEGYKAGHGAVSGSK